MPTITLEEHFVTESFLRATQKNNERFPPLLAELKTKLLNLGEGRIADMDKSGIDFQVLSLAAMGFDALDPEAGGVPLPATAINDELADAVRAYPERIGGFATLALKAPDTAAAEDYGALRHRTSLGFHGALVNGTTGGLFLDDPRFLPVLEAAAHLGVPIYLHPAPPPQPVSEGLLSRVFPGDLQLFSSPLRAGAGTLKRALHTLRLIVSGLLDRFSLDYN